jgi:diguanylate cyclase (GGDEF)-like protein
VVTINKNSLDVIEFKKWNRKILNVYWIVTLIAAITETVIYFLVAVPRGSGSLSYFAEYTIRPTVFNIFLFSISELVHRLIKDRFKEAAKYLIILAGTLLVCNLVYVHYSVSVIYVLFVLPIMLSVYYGSNKITMFSMAINVALYLLVITLYLPTMPVEKVKHNLTDICTTIAIIISAGLIVRSFIDRANEIVKTFVTMYENERDLTIKNFVMEFNSKIEPLTGLYNHKTFYQYLGDLIEQSENFKFPLSVAVLDIDNFKKVNDTYGHSYGDDVIKSLAEIIKDSIGTDDYGARYGGEEFAIIFTDKDKYKTFEVMETIRTKFNNKIIKGMEDERFSVSIGISQHREGMTMQNLFSNADSAQYSSKRTGKNRTTIYEVK